MDERLIGNWKHVKKSQEWENYNENFAKGRVGTFSDNGNFLKWDSIDKKVTLFIEPVKLTFHNEGKQVLIRHRSGLMYWFSKAGDKDGTDKKKAVKRRLPKTSDGGRDKESNA